MTANVELPTQGAKPAGTRDQAGAALAVQGMFDSIAPRYDVLNHVLSLNIDRLWWWRTARRFRRVLGQPEAVVVDVCCGTGDMTLALLRLRPRVSDGSNIAVEPIIAVDFSHEMLRRGEAKFRRREANVVAVEADALHLPVAGGTVDLITTAFGFRNLANYGEGLREFHRVLRPGGALGILDFSEPGGLMGRIYKSYFRRLLPWIGSRVSGVAGPYAYLPASVENFPSPTEMLEQVREVGFKDVSWTPYSFGIAGLYRGVKG